MNGRFKLFGKPELKSPSLLVTWNEDASGVGAKVGAQLSRRLPYEHFGEIEPAEFFPLAGITVENNLVRFPESRFYWCPGSDLILFNSDPPACEWYGFLDLVLEVARDYCHVRELYAVGGMISLAAHTTPRQLLAVFNSAEFKSSLSQYDLATELDYRTPQGQRPTLNSFLLWAAKRRGLPAANLWVPTPFYLLSAGDPSGEKMVLEFLSRRCSLRLDLSGLEEEIRQQAARIAELRSRVPEIDRSIARLESNLGLSEEDNEKLVKGVEELFKGEG